MKLINKKTGEEFEVQSLIHDKCEVKMSGNAIVVDSYFRVKSVKRVITCNGTFKI